jgi:hypothetical protein
MKRINLSTSERGKRILKRLRQLEPFLPASLVVTRKRCGRKDCRCAQQGAIHPTAHVTWKEYGKTQTLHVPQELVEEVAQWVEQWKALRKLIGQMGIEQRKHLIQLRKDLKD